MIKTYFVYLMDSGKRDLNFTEKKSTLELKIYNILKKKTNAIEGHIK